MGTRGVLGVIVGGEEKMQYAQYDSYPDGWIGGCVEYVAGEMAAADRGAAMVWLATTLTVVHHDSKPTAEEIAHCQKMDAVDLTVSEQSVDDWYCLLRNTQGDLRKMLEVGYVRDAKDFLNDSLFCEFAYIFNFDTMKLEFYKGGVLKRPLNRPGRYIQRFGGKPKGWKPRYEGEDFYFPVRPLAEWDIHENMDPEAILRTMTGLNDAVDARDAAAYKRKRKKMASAKG